MICLVLMHCIGATWVYKYDLTCENFSRFSVRLLNICYWVPLIGTGYIHFVDYNLMLKTGAAFFVWLFFVIIVIKFIVDCERGEKISWHLYYTDFVCYGSMQLFENTLELSHEIVDHAYWIQVLKFWWSISIKYFIPFVLWQIFLIFDIGDAFGSDEDTDLSYSGYESKGETKADTKELLKWQIVKIVFIAPFFLLILYFACSNRFNEEDFDLDYLHLQIKEIVKPKDGLSKGEVELVEIKEKPNDSGTTDHSIHVKGSRVAPGDTSSKS